MFDMSKTLTIFTPTYNRAHTIGRTYASLCRQTCKDFEWLIIDDGSSDNTRELVEGWITENKIPIRYIYQENQGMHGAHNTAYKNIHTELNTCIDSDDWMPDDAVEIIVNTWKKEGNSSLSGLVGLDIVEDGSVIGTKFPEDRKTIKVGKFYEEGGKGDKKLVYRTDIINSVPDYPIFEGERYLGLAYKYLIVEEKYEMLAVNHPMVVVDYQQDGSSFGMYRQYWNNPNGWMFYRKFEMDHASSFTRKLKLSIHYVASCIRANRVRDILDNSQPFLTLMLLPVGIAFYYYTKYKVTENQKMDFNKKINK